MIEIEKKLKFLKNCPMSIDQGIELSHAIAKLKGFWIEQKGRLKPRNTSELIMLVITELAEAVEALRRNDIQGKDKTWRKDTFEDEIADSIIRLFDLCGALDIDLDLQIKKKLMYNLSRPYKHGKKF